MDNEEKKEDGATCCLTLPLKLEKWQSDHLEKRFEIARQLYNTLVHAELKKKCQVERMPEYQEIMKMIDAASNQKEKWALEKKRKAFLEENGFSRNAFKADMEKYYKHFNDNIGANVALHGITAQVWIAFDKVFVDNYKQQGKYISKSRVNFVPCRAIHRRKAVERRLCSEKIELYGISKVIVTARR